MQSQLMNYFHKLLTPQQYGFRPNLSTELAAVELMDRNIHIMKTKNTPINIFLDLSKAFDSLDHDILLSKLKFDGLQKQALVLMKSYLLGRHQVVQINDAKSSIHKVLYGIPQGSVMGPLLFNIFINDITKASTILKLVMYADDTTLVTSIENFGPITEPGTVENALNDEIDKISHWLLMRTNLC